MLDPFGEDLPRKKKIIHELGQDLSLLSVEELEDRIVQLEAEVERLRQAKSAKLDSRKLADGFFKS
jgi:uncharacterized small protein (DUF1192 family)